MLMLSAKVENLSQEQYPYKNYVGNKFLKIFRDKKLIGGEGWAILSALSYIS